MAKTQRATSLAIIIHNDSAAGGPHVSRNLIRVSNPQQAHQMAEALSNVSHVQAIPCRQVYDVFGKAFHVSVTSSLDD